MIALLLLLFACSTHHIHECRDSAVLPDAGVVYDCPPPTTVAIHEAEAGPVVMCLCPAAAVVGMEVTP